MVPRLLQFHVGLFLMVYSACLFYYWTSEQSQQRSGQWATTLQSIFPRDGIVSKLESSGRVDLARRDATTIGAVESVNKQINPITPLGSTNSDLSEETRQEVSTLSEQATSASEPRARANAIVKLRNSARTEESVQALVGALHGDQSGQNRMFAIASLLNMARQGDDDGTVKAALRRAMSDEDPRVAARARQALDGLAGVKAEAE